MKRWLSILRHSVWPAVWHTWPFWMFLLTPVGAWLVGGWFGSSRADQLRYFGTVLQLLGIVLVAVGIRDLRRDFNRPNVFAAIRDGFLGVVRSFNPNRTISLTGVGAVALAGAAAIGYGRVGGTVEQRLDGLEREIDDIRKQAQERDRQTERKLSDLRGELEKESQARIQAHADIQRRMEKVAVGGIYLDMIGLCWLVLATLATCIPDELARWLP